MNEYFFLVDDCKVGPIIMDDLPLNLMRYIRKEFALNLGMSWGYIELVRDNGNNL